MNSLKELRETKETLNRVLAANDAATAEIERLAGELERVQGVARDFDVERRQVRGENERLKYKLAQEVGLEGVVPNPDPDAPDLEARVKALEEREAMYDLAHRNINKWIPKVEQRLTALEIVAEREGREP